VFGCLLHLDARYAQTSTGSKRDVVVGDYIYPLLLSVTAPKRPAAEIFGPGETGNAPGAGE
jgi:hypothetical protein